MEYQAFLNKVIDDAIVGLGADYKPGTPKLRGSVAGLEACRGRSPEDLVALRKKAQAAVDLARSEDATPEVYWELRCFALEVEWVRNCVVAAGFAVGPVFDMALVKVADVLGVRPFPTATV